ncbi:MAG: MBL fold metallo-hydrolase [Eubacterium sp.]
MKLTVLVDNHTSCYVEPYFLGEPGLCYYIEDDGMCFLWDTGYTDIFIKNAEKMGIDLSTIDAIVLSHGHNDHTRGLDYYFKTFDNPKLKIICHPNALISKSRDGENIGMDLSETYLKEHCELILTKEPYPVSKNITFLGEIGKSTDFEPRKAMGTICCNGCEDDYLFDDSALAYKTDEGVYIVTGCSHSGICNIAEQAKTVTDTTQVLGIIGGFHLYKRGEQVDRTIDYFIKNKIDILYPCHCTAFKIIAAIHQAIPLKREVSVGMTLEW